MSRVIKFRVWDKHTKEMLSDVTYDKELEGGVRPWIFMQFTGLMDCKGREIWEGDICNYKFIAQPYHPLQITSSDFNVVVKYCVGKGCFVLEEINGVAYHLFERFKQKQDDDSQTKLEVIGNIYKNPELLKGGAKEQTHREAVTNMDKTREEVINRVGKFLTGWGSGGTAWRMATELYDAGLLAGGEQIETANLGYATTRELLEEISARIEVTRGGLDYSTVNGFIDDRVATAKAEQEKQEPLKTRCDTCGSKDLPPIKSCETCDNGFSNWTPKKTDTILECFDILQRKIDELQHPGIRQE